MELQEGYFRCYFQAIFVYLGSILGCFWAISVILGLFWACDGVPGMLFWGYFGLFLGYFGPLGAHQTTLSYSL